MAVIRSHTQPGFLLPLLLSGHGGHEDGRADDSIRLPSGYQCALHTACKYGGKQSGRPCFVAGERLPRNLQHNFVVNQRGLPADSLASHFYDVVKVQVPHGCESIGLCWPVH